MIKPNIPDLQQVLKQKCLDYLHDNNITYPKGFDDSKLEKFVHWIVYGGALSKLVLSLNRLENYKLIWVSRNLIFFTFYGEVKNSILFEIVNQFDFMIFDGKQSCNVSRIYLDYVICKHLPPSLHKKFNSFDYSQAKIFYMHDIAVSMIDFDDTIYKTYPQDFYNSSLYELFRFNNDLYGQVGMTFYSGQINKDFVDTITNFIKNGDESLLIIEDKNYYKIKNPLNKIVGFCKGVRLFKLQHTNYNEEISLINNEVSIFKHILNCGDINEYCIKYLLGCVSFELSPDRYLEIYATNLGLTRLFIDLIFKGFTYQIFENNFSYVELTPSSNLSNNTHLINPIRVGALENITFCDIYIQFSKNQREYCDFSTDKLSYNFFPF